MEDKRDTRKLKERRFWKGESDAKRKRK